METRFIVHIDKNGKETKIPYLVSDEQIAREQASVSIKAYIDGLTPTPVNKIFKRLWETGALW